MWFRLEDVAVPAAISPTPSIQWDRLAHSQNFRLGVHRQDRKPLSKTPHHLQHFPRYHFGALVYVSLMSVQELESAVTTLPAEELHQFAQWFEEYLASQWDEQIAADAASGKLKALLDEADADYAAGNCTTL